MKESGRLIPIIGAGLEEVGVDWLVNSAIITRLSMKSTIHFYQALATFSTFFYFMERLLAFMIDCR